jgi:phage protein D
MTQNGSALFYASRPRLRIDGTLVADLGDSLLQSLLIEETTLGLFRCEANFINWGQRAREVGYLFFERDVLDFGKTFSVEFGPPGEAGPVFAGRISGMEATFPQARPPEVTILAEDRFQDLRMERRTRTFEDVTDADAMRQIVSQQGMTAQIDVDGPTHRLLAQVNQSDLAFVRERAAAVDAELWIDNRTVYVQARSRRSHGTVTFTYGDDLLEFTVLADLAHQRTAVRVSGWDVAEKEAIDVEAGRSAISAEVNGYRGGSQVLEALTPRTERVALTTPLSQQEAQSLAEARYRARARSFVRGKGAVNGNARLRVGTTVELANLGPLFDGPYYVTLARHTFDPIYGYRTLFHAERPGIGG